MDVTRRTLLTSIAALAVGTTLAACGGNSSSPNAPGASQATGGTLIVDASFNVKSIDPARQFEFTGSMIDVNLYQTALRFDKGDFSKPIDGLCSYEISDDQKVITLTMKDTGAKFSDGTPVTIDDFVFSFQRLQGVKGNPSFYLDGVTVAKKDDKSLTLTSEAANPTLLFILPNSNMGAVNSKVVIANGGTTDESDGAEQFLNNNSQGSGAYMIEKYDPATEIVLVLNPHYVGDKPKYDRVVVRNVTGETQKVNVESGQSDIAMDLSTDQVAALDRNAVTIVTYPSGYSLYMFMNGTTSVNPWASNPDFQTAVRKAVDYDKLVELAGEGARQIGAPIPNNFAGHVPADKLPKRDLAAAAEALKAAGYNGEAVPFHYASDGNVAGVQIANVAQSVQASLKEAGINIDLKPAPASTQLDGFRSGNQPMGLASWGADYPDPENYLVFAPGGSLTKRAAWPESMVAEMTELTEAAKTAGVDTRAAAYEKLYTRMSEQGPFLGLIQPAKNVVGNAKKVKEFVSNIDTSLLLSSVK